MRAKLVPMNLWNQIEALGQSFPVSPKMARRLGLEAAVFLCRIAWWQRAPDGEAQASRELIEQETGLSEKQQVRVQKELVAAGLLKVRYDRLAHEQWYQVDVEALELAFREPTKAPLPNRQKGGSLTKEKKLKKKNPPTPPKGGVGGLGFAVPAELASEAFEKAWREFELHRREMGHKLTPRSVELMFRNLSKLKPEDRVHCVLTSIEKGWRGLFMEKYTPVSSAGVVRGQRPPPRHSHSEPAHMRAGLDRDNYRKRIRVIGSDEEEAKNQPEVGDPKAGQETPPQTPGTDTTGGS